jgi:CheY-like chemotaxis protein
MFEPITLTRRRRSGVVLLVDDYAESRATVRELLDNNGYEVIEAAHGQQALDFLVSSPEPPVQLIVLDLQMPIMNGYQFLTLLGNYVRLSTIPVLVVSGHAAPSDQETYRNVVGYLRPPYQADELLALVNASCSQPADHAGPGPGR